VSDKSLLLHSVSDRGVPIKERVILQALTSDVDVSYFALLVGVVQPGITTLPVPDKFFWFGNGQLNEGDWIFVYTGPGTGRIETLPDGKRLFSLFWQQKNTLFYDRNIVPVLIRIQDVSILQPVPAPEPLPHISPELQAALNRFTDQQGS
jgi:hypothetical protein